MKRINLTDNLSNLKFWLIKNKRKLICFFSVFALIVALISSQICILFIETNSIPFSVCLQIRYLPPQKYDLCALNYNGHKLVKYIIGIEGDKIINLVNAIYVGGFRVGKAEKTDLLTPIENCTIPEGYVFVSGRHPKSLDSRYKEFGLIKVSDLEGKIFGLVKRDDFREDTFINWRD